MVSESSKLQNYIKRSTLKNTNRAKVDLDKIEALQTLFIQIGSTVIPIQIKYETEFALREGHRTKFGPTQLLHHEIERNKFSVEVKEAIPLHPAAEVKKEVVEDDEDFDDDEEETTGEDDDDEETTDEADKAAAASQP